MCKSTMNYTREMENISRGPTLGNFVTILTEGSIQNNTVPRLQSTRVRTVLTLLSPPASSKVKAWSMSKSNVLSESLSEDSQNIPCATLKSGGPTWVISIYLWIRQINVTICNKSAKILLIFSSKGSDLKPDPKYLKRIQKTNCTGWGGGGG